MIPKRLLDDGAQGTARELLTAGRDVRVSQHGKKQLLAAAAGGAVILGSKAAVAAKVSGWLGGNFAAKIGIGFVLVGSTAWVLTKPQDERPAVLASQGAVDRASSLGARLPALSPVTRDVVVAPLIELAAEETPEPLTARVVTRHPRTLPLQVSDAAEPSFSDRLRLEAQLVEQLRAAVAAKDWHRCDTLLARHRAEFSDGQLSPEVRALRQRISAARAGE